MLCVPQVAQYISVLFFLISHMKCVYVWMDLNCDTHVFSVFFSVYFAPNKIQIHQQIWIWIERSSCHYGTNRLAPFHSLRIMRFSRLNVFVVYFLSVFALFRCISVMLFHTRLLVKFRPCTTVHIHTKFNLWM